MFVVQRFRGSECAREANQRPCTFPEGRACAGAGFLASKANCLGQRTKHRARKHKKNVNKIVDKVLISVAGWSYFISFAAVFRSVGWFKGGCSLQFDTVHIVGASKPKVMGALDWVWG
jgi:hypothetical protein